VYCSPLVLLVYGSKETIVEEKAMTDQDAWNSILCCMCLNHFPKMHLTSPTHLIPSDKSKTFTSSLKLSTLTFALLFGYHLLFWKVYFHKIKGMEIFSRSCNDLNTANDSMGLTKLLCINWASSWIHRNLKFLYLKFLMIYLFFIALDQNHVQ
jgi:hypothetical protein